MTLNLGKPSATQDRFLRATKKHVAFGGARGGGKSWAVRAKAIVLGLSYPGIKLLIVRRTYKELLNNHIAPLRETLVGVGQYHGTDKMIRLPNGSSISFGYCATDADLDQYQGAEYDVVFLDEATQLDEQWISKITASVRGVNSFPKRVYYTCNPGGRSHGYIKRLFIDRQFQPGENPDDYTFIQSRVTDNHALMEAQPDYIKQLEALPPKLRKAWLDGAWDIFDGQFFEDFRDDPAHYKDRLWTHVIEPFQPPEGWPILRSFDFGYAKPFSCAWWAVDYDGRLYRILEWYGCQRDHNGIDIPNEGLKIDPDAIFSHIHDIEHQHPYLAGKKIMGVADPSIWDASRGESVAESGIRHGVLFTPGDNHRIAGWMQCHYRLRFDSEGVPGMYVFSNCRAFIRTIPTLIYDERHPEDLDTSMEDHVADEWRYLCMSRPIKPAPVIDPEPVYEDPLNQMQHRR